MLKKGVRRAPEYGAIGAGTGTAKAVFIEAPFPQMQINSFA